MKTVLVHLDGELQPGDILTLSHSHPVRGGRTNARFDVPAPRDEIRVVDGQKVVVTEATKIRDVVQNFVSQVGRWEGFNARQRNDHELVIQCADGVDQSVFVGEGTGDRQTFTFETLA